MREHELGEQHLAGLMALTRAASWNQNEADWRMMLRLGRGWGLSTPEGTLAASIIVLPYGDKFAWMSMVLVSPEHRRKGYASRMLRRALAELRAEGRYAVLDATPAGHEVYVQEGLRDSWGFQRYRRTGAPARAPGAELQGVSVRPLRAQDWTRVLEMDLPAFGASREALLRALAARLPEAALVAERDGVICGYLLGREGREARQLGPLIAQDESIAQALLAHALARIPGPFYADIVDRHGALREWALAQGFAVQRPFMRMVHGADRAPGDNQTVMLAGGPELG